MAGSLQYPHAGEQKEGEDNCTSKGNECADKKSSVWLVVPRICAPSEMQDQEHTIACVVLHVVKNLGLWKDKSSTVYFTSHGS